MLVFWFITWRQPCGATSIFDGILNPNPGFQSLTEELSHCLVRPGSIDGRKERLYHLEKAVANSIEMKEDGLTAMQDKYNMYKEGNIKFLRFNPDEKTSRKKRTFSRLHLNPKVFAF